MELTLQKNSFSQALALATLRLKSWKLDITLPDSPKFVMIGAPHTSNWDLLSALLIKYGAGINMRWIGKESLFRWPIGGMMRRLGGIPVDRHSRNNFVSQVVETFNRLENLVIAISPEGTRSKTHYWRTGFYYIALGAGVPIALGYVDYGNKVVGIGPSIIPTGDLQADFVRIKEFYTGIKGRHPELQGEIILRPD